MKFYVVAHPARARQAEKLASMLGAHIVMDHDCDGAYANHHRALTLASRHAEHVTILEDDALPVVGYIEKLQAWVDRFPDAVISSYLGTGYPVQWMPTVDALWDSKADYITLPALIHCVGVTYPPHAPALILDALSAAPDVDFAIGDAWPHNIIYPKRSLVDHEDGQPVVDMAARRAGDMPRVLPRKARALA